MFSKSKHPLTIFKRRYSSKWNSIVGLEIHAQINSASKLFSGASTTYSSPVNDSVSLFDCSIPGTLPVLNKRCVEAGVLTALALNCELNMVSYFDRKHYFYADLPTGYQITQQRAPLAINGQLGFQVYSPGIHKVPYRTSASIKQLQLEQDSGRSLHDEDRSLIDLNRAGVPLMEIVFEPDLKDGEEAASLVKELRLILLSINTCSCKMEEGAMRVDANISINKHGEPMGVRTEVKNIGSIRGVAGAVDYEIKRQIKLKESNMQIVNETRSWDAAKKITVPMRDKEVLQDYRFMPEPNLPSIHLSMGPIEHGCVHIDKLKESIPELPEETRQRVQVQSGLSMEQSIMLVNDQPLLKIFEAASKVPNMSHKKLASFLLNEVNTLLNKKEMDSSELKCPPMHIGEIVELLESQKINRNTAKIILDELISGNVMKPIKIVEEKQLLQITDDVQLIIICEAVMKENEKAVKEYRSGKVKVFKAILAAIFAKSEGRADMAKCAVILKDLLQK